MRLLAKIGVGVLVFGGIGALLDDTPSASAPARTDADSALAAEREREQADAELIRRARRAMRGRLRDPGSAEFGVVLVARGSGGPVVCGAVNAKNGFGGYTGMKLFVMPAGGALVGEEDVSADTFASLWTSSRCQAP